MNLTVMLDGSERIDYRDPSVPIYIRRGNLVGLPNMAALCHWHEDIELLMPLRGYLTYNVNGTRVTVQDGNAIFVNARQMHYGYSADGTDCEYVCITFRPALLCANEEIRNRYVLPVLTSPSLTHMVLRSSIGAHHGLLGAIRKLDALNRQSVPGHELLALGILYNLWWELCQLVQDQLGEAVSTDLTVAVQKQMLEFIRGHYQERITVDAIAAAGGVCRTKCCQIFKKYLGLTPNDYLNSFRLEKGMELLKSTRLSVTEIASACGFSSGSYFTELFTREKGCTPTRYRKQ